MTSIREPVSLRPAVAADAGAILVAQRSAIRDGDARRYYSERVIEEWGALEIPQERVDAFARWITQGEELLVVAEASDGEIIAFGSIVPTNAELRAVYVAADHVRRGIGGAILQRLFEMARGSGVKELTMDASLNAVAFYERHGFSAMENAMHKMPSGQEMSCVRMCKRL